MSLEELRRKIDRIDRRIVELLAERFRVARRVVAMKERMGLPVVDAERRSAVLRGVEERAKRLGLEPAFAVKVFEDVVRAVEGEGKGVPRVAYLGPRGTFSMDAANKFFPSTRIEIPQRTVEDVFKSVESGEATHGVVPVENSLEGSYGAALDALLSTSLTVVGEAILPVSHCLAAKSGVSLDGVRAVYSHPQALAQCRRFLEEFLPKAQRREASSTARAAILAKRVRGAAAICSEAAAGLYGLAVAARNIQDERNFTRFLVLSREQAPPTGDDKTSVVFSTRHVPGALHKALTPFASRGINLTRIESRPVRGQPWEYMFFVDLQGHRGEERVGEALRELEELTIQLKVLGSYPRGDTAQA